MLPDIQYLLFNNRFTKSKAANQEYITYNNNIIYEGAMQPFETTAT